MKHSRIIVTIFAIASMMACSREDVLSNYCEEMTFTASIDNNYTSTETKSAVSSTIVPFGDGMALTIKESDIEDNFEEVVTKGKVVTTENFSDLICRAGRMHITAFNKNGDSSVPYISDYFKYDGQYWRPLQSTYWPDYPMDIYAIARPIRCNFPYDKDSPDTYYPDSNDMDWYGFSLLHDIDIVNRTYWYYNDSDEGPEDYLFAKAESDPNYSGSLNLTFKHILTAVKFVTGSNIPSGTVKDIRIGGIYTSALFHFDTEEWDFKDAEKFYWTKLHVPGINYYYYYDDDYDDYEHYLNYKTTEGEAGSPITDEFQTLFIIPQECDENAYIEIDFQFDGESAVRTYQIPLPDGFEFKMGKQVTFSIGSNSSDYSFYFSEDGFSDVDFSKSSSTDIPLISIHRGSSETNFSAPWKIASYQVGTNAPVEVNAEEVNTGDILLKRDGNTLQVKDSRTPVNQSTHEYWSGSNGAWSPAAYSGDSIDLSKFDMKTEVVNAYSMTTSNCYIIRHAGTYRLPLVYGSAMVNGVENVESYYPAVNDTDDTHQYECKNFPNYNGTPISSAFIENNEDCIPTGSAIIWQDNGEIISNLEIVGDEIGEITELNKYDASTVRYLQFKVDQSTIHQGNALICIYKDLNTNDSYDDGEEIWLWHIWITNNPSLLEPDIQIKPYTSGATSYFFPMYCLGWIDTDTYLECEDVTVTLQQDESMSTVSFIVHLPQMLAAPSHGTFYKYGINRPYKDYVYLTGHDKFYNNGWTGYNFDLSKGASKENFIKTIYDPSPVGYVLSKNEFQKYQIDHPKSKAYNIYTDFSITSYPYGMMITDRENRTIFFPENSKISMLFGDMLPCGFYIGSLMYNPTLVFHDKKYYDLYHHDNGEAWVTILESGAVRPVRQL